MRRVVATGVRTIELETVEDPSLPGTTGAIVRVEAAAICGSDLHFYDGDLPLYPLAVGHEAIGVVDQVGPEVQTFSVGDRVLLTSAASCGSCESCLAGDPMACFTGARVYGIGGDLAGAQAEYVAVPSADVNLVAIPDGMDDATALVMTDNLPTGWAGALRAAFVPGESVAVIGLGPVGQCAVRAAIARGASRVFAIDPVPGRRDLAAASGAIPVNGSVVDAVLAQTDGRGVAAVIDAVGRNATLDDAIAMTRNSGTVSVVGVHKLDPYPFPLMAATYRSITLRTTTTPVHRALAQVWPLVIAGRIDVADLVTDWFPFDEADKAYALAAERRGNCMKVALRIS